MLLRTLSQRGDTSRDGVATPATMKMKRDACSILGLGGAVGSLGVRSDSTTLEPGIAVLRVGARRLIVRLAFPEHAAFGPSPES